MTEAATEVTWKDVSPTFGIAHRFGCCDALVGSTVCGWPRNADGTCRSGHPSRPGWTDPKQTPEEKP